MLRPHRDAATGDVARDPASGLAEAEGLAHAIDLDIVHSEWLRLSKPRPGTLIGTGAVERLAALVEELEVEVAVVDASLSPVQQRNLERAWKTKVIDRTALILEIFGARARTHEGRLQVELASLTFQRSRLVRSWTHLERQRGGAGFLGGPGESQLELDRRIISDRIVRIKKELESVVRTRELHREARRRVPFPVIALVGYTNAGKSTLFNRLTAADVMAEDMLFATLDPTMRRLVLPSGRQVILSDTVGFVSDLPHQLVAAFRATLEEVMEADVILHVRDVSHVDTEAQRADVLSVLSELGISTDGEHRLIEVLNKIDLLDPEARAALRERTRDSGDLGDNVELIALSAVSGEGCDALLDRLDRRVEKDGLVRRLVVEVSNGAAIAWLYRHGSVLEREDDGMEAHLKVVLDPSDAERFQALFNQH